MILNFRNILKTSASFITKPMAGYIVILLFFIIGMFIVRDYGINIDEPQQLRWSRIVYNLLMRDILEKSKSENVQMFLRNIEAEAIQYDINPYNIRISRWPWHSSLLVLLVGIEHLNDFTLSSDNVLLIRHIYIFLTFTLGGLFFFFILKKRFPESPVAFFGLLMYLLYPRFFGEAFHNIKDIPFFSWYIISVFFGLNYLEKPLFKTLFPFALTAAVATNIRIMGFSIPILVITYIIMNGFLEKNDISVKNKLKPVIFNVSLLLLLYIGFYFIISPSLWQNPVYLIKSYFIRWATASFWDYMHFYLGQMITKNVPWHYIPVWMGVTVPIGYIILFLAGSVTIVISFNKLNLKNSKTLYDSFFLCLFYLTLLGFIILKITMYTGWRHSYFIFASFLYIAVTGLDYIYTLCKRTKISSICFSAVFFGYMISLGWWIAYNHPYQYIFFNEISRGKFADQNFVLDYYGVSTNDILREILKIDSRSQIIIGYNNTNNIYLEMLTPEERLRIKRLGHELEADPAVKPDYIIRGSRGHIRTREDFNDYEKIYNITVDNCEIISLHKYTK